VISPPQPGPERRVLGVLGLGPEPDDNDVEIASLRHQVGILERQASRARYTNSDRVVLSTLAGLLPRDRWGRPLSSLPAWVGPTIDRYSADLDGQEPD